MMIWALISDFGATRATLYTSACALAHAGDMACLWQRGDPGYSFAILRVLARRMESWPLVFWFWPSGP